MGKQASRCWLGVLITTPFRKQGLESRVRGKLACSVRKGENEKGHEMIMGPGRYPTSFGMRPEDLGRIPDTTCKGYLRGKSE
jgi:hypothetical protein